MRDAEHDPPQPATTAAVTVVPGGPVADQAPVWINRLVELHVLAEHGDPSAAAEAELWLAIDPAAAGCGTTWNTCAINSGKMIARARLGVGCRTCAAPQNINTRA